MSKHAQHTPGDWFFDESDSVILDGHGKIASALAELRKAPGGGDQALANGHLFAAAPDLLAALQDILDHIRFEEVEEMTAQWGKARAAIAAALAQPANQPQPTASSRPECRCECPVGPCGHKWDGQPVLLDSHMSSRTCSKCGMTNMNHNLEVEPTQPASST